MFENVKKEYIEKRAGNWTLNDKIGLSPEVFFRNGKSNDWQNYFTQEISDVFDTKTKEKWANNIDIIYNNEVLMVRDINIWLAGCKLAAVKIPMTGSPGLRVFTISIDVSMNTICNYIAYIRITWHKSCLITVHVPRDRTHSGKASRKMIYILPLEECI